MLVTHRTTGLRWRGAIVATSLAVAWSGLQAEKAGPAEVAARLSGTWKLNRDLSDSMSAPGRGGGALFAVGGSVQRGGRGGGGGEAPSTSADMTPEELAAQAAVRQLQSVPETVTIKATADSVSFNDTRGERTYPVNGKKTAIDVAEAKVNVKTSWDKATLKQEFSTPKTSLTQTWQVDDSNHLVLRTKVESMTMVSKEVKIVFDKQ
jgi:hypothetical protein